VWVQNVTVTKSDNLYSTAGVSNAVEGSLAVIDGLFGRAVVQKVINDIHYPYEEIKLDHSSIGVNGRNKMAAFKKIFFRKNRNLEYCLRMMPMNFIWPAFWIHTGEHFLHH
jgi:hypothetical protein